MGQRIQAALNRLGHTSRRRIILALALAVPAALLTINAAIIAGDGLIDEPGKADLIVVLGNKVEDDGTPSRRLRARLDKAADVYFAGRGKLIFASGGFCEGWDEARSMKQYLVSRGVPARDIIEDNQGIHTFHTAKNAAAYLREHGLRGAVVVTQYYHIPRSRMCLARFHVQPVYSYHADFFEWRDFYSVYREVAGYWVYTFFKPWPE